MKKSHFLWAGILGLFIGLSACGDYGDYGEDNYRITNYVFSDNEGSTSCAMQYSGEQLSQLTYLFSDGGEFMDDGYTEISYNGNTITMEGYYPQEGQYIHQINRVLEVSNGKVLSFEYEDLYDFNAHEKFEMTYVGGKIDRVDYYAMTQEGFRKRAYYQWVYNGYLWNMQGYIINEAGESIHFYQSAFESKNGRVKSRYESYRNSNGEGFSIDGGEEREYTEDYLSKIKWIDFDNGNFTTYATTDFQYSDKGLIDYEQYLENDGSGYSYSLEYEEGLGNYELFNFMLYYAFYEIYWDYPLFKSAKHQDYAKYFRGSGHSSAMK